MKRTDCKYKNACEKHIAHLILPFIGDLVDTELLLPIIVLKLMMEIDL